MMAHRLGSRLLALARRTEDALGQELVQQVPG